MIIKSSKTLAQFRGPGYCGICGLFCKKREPDHAVFTKGAGGSDVRENLLAVCHHRISLCHRKRQDGNSLTRAEVLEKIAQREGYPSGEAVLDFLWWLRNIAPKGTPLEEVEAKRSELRLRKAG